MSVPPAILCILDGWGIGSYHPDNGVWRASTPNYDRMICDQPSATLRTDGEFVGLPEGQFGNSEVGHLNLGAGRVVLQDLPRINAGINDKSLFQAQAFNLVCHDAKEQGKTIHLVGLLSDGGIHSHQEHLFAIIRELDQRQIPAIVHAITDGRDTGPEVACQYLDDLNAILASCPKIKLGTLMGRYHAMDRDKRWERTKLAYDAIVAGMGLKTDDVRKAIETSYANGINDEFIHPIICQDYQGLQNGDSLLFFNYRSDRMRQIVSSLIDPDFSAFERRPLEHGRAVTMTSYSDALDGLVDGILSPPHRINDHLGAVVADHGLRQLRMAESEKRPHVTYFFSGGNEDAVERENRIIVPSPGVATYELAPEMSADELIGLFLAEIEKNSFDFCLINFANPDMVGHTGSMEAVIKALETVDRALGLLLEAAERYQARIIVTADHGNCELMRDPQTGGLHKAHTTNPVSISVIGMGHDMKLRSGALCDVAPTLLDMMGIEKPATMTGRSLIEPVQDSA